MKKITTTIYKELLLLFRDKTGLLVLFVMPAALVLIVTLIQENLLKTDIRVLFIDNDKKEISREMETLLQRADNIKLIKQPDGSELTEEYANNSVAKGLYQFSIIIPDGTTEAVTKKSLQKVKKLMFDDRMPEEIAVPEIIIFYDPTIQGSFRVAVNNIVSRVINGVEQKLKFRHVLDLLPEKIKQAFPDEFREYIPDDNSLLPLREQLENEGAIIKTKETFATKMGFTTKPTSVQQNVPAWTLFGIFFIIVPIAGSLINERESGTLLRLRSMPVSYFVIMCGKITAYTFICFGQFGIILIIGKFVLPLFGCPPFSIGPKYWVFFLILLSSISAATGFGILLGTIMKTYEQASMLGPVSVVIAAAVGGIMVPVYAMPEFIQPFTVLSPLSWGQDAFYDILLRGGGLASALPEICSLFACFIGSIGTACFFMFYKNQN